MSDKKARGIFLVVLDPGGLHGAYLDRDLAHRVAEAVEGVVAELPVASDYRNPSGATP